MNENERRIMVTTDGREIELRPVSQLLLQRINGIVEKEFKERGEQVDVPQYRIELPGEGEYEYHDHDDESIKSAPEDERQQWDDHLDCRERMALEARSRRGTLLYKRGLEYEKEEAQAGAWVAEQEEDGFDVPEDPAERFMHWVETELLKTPADQMNAFIGIIEASSDGAPEEMIQAAREFFRSQVAWEASAVDFETAMDEAEGLVDDQ